MDPFKNKLKDIERKDWRLWLLMSVVFFLFVVFITSLVFYSDIKSFYEEEMGEYSFNLLFVGFLGLSLLFLAYIITQSVSLRKIRNSLIEERANTSTLENQLQELKDLFEVCSMVNSKVDLPKILDTIAKEIIHCFKADQSSIMFYNPNTDKLECVAAYGLSSDMIKGKELEFGKSVTGWVVKNNKPLLLQGEINHSMYNGYVEKNRNITSALCVPLKVNSLVKGVLNVNLINREKRFSENELYLLSIFAESAGLSIEKASLHQELKDRMNQLIQTEKFKAVGKLISALMHDFNNFLSIIIGRAQLLSVQTRDTNLSKHIEAVIKVATQAADIIQRLNQFGIPIPEKEFRNLDLNKLVKEAVELTKSKWNEWAKLKGIKIKIEQNLSSISPISGNPADLREVIINMILNSIDALPKGGVISFNTREEEDAVFLSIKDNGIGMSEEVKNKIFDPFFSTKHEKGNGLGMTVVYSILIQHNGKITVESEEGKGTTFTIKLPVLKLDKKEDISELNLLAEKINVLLIEDDEDLQAVLVEMLTQEGFEVKCACSGTEGISLIKIEKYDIIITDLGISGMTGWAFAEQAKEINSKIPIILVSGWGEQMLTKDAKDLGVEVVLSKPIKRENLKTAITRALKLRVKTKEFEEPPSREKNYVRAL
ncbi:MAG: ATP-binding protein [candidate division Zixibacteria bacterium]|nr:ATP-binding protein [candidate division Zixibacteria bacterium]